MTTQRQDDFGIAERAADWFLVLQADPQRQTEFGAWLRESPRHVEEFLLVTAAYRALDTVRQDQPIDINAARATLVSSIVALSTNEIHQSGRSRRGLQRRWLTAGAAAASLTIVVAGIVAWVLFAGGERYSTRIGEIRSFELQDRSVVHLNTHSKVAVHYSAAAREVELRDGEALFKVARDPQRPFRVYTDRATIQAIGTEFNVYRRPQGTTVSVIEGRVRVSRSDQTGSAVDIRAGEEVNITADRAMVPVVLADPVKVISWRERRLLFKNDPLSEVGAEFNRHNRSLRIRVEGQAARNKQLTGIFDADDPESLLLFLKDVPELVIERGNAEVVIRER